MSTPAELDLLFEVSGGIGTITINRPEARNAFTPAMYDRVTEIFETAGRDGGIKALIITGAGDKAFSAGTEISHFLGFDTEADALGYETFMERVFSAIEGCPVPTIAAIAGACTGGGGLIAACCDLRIGTAGMKFGFPIARTLGNCLSARNLARLSAILGMPRVKELIFTARLMGAEESHRAGLLTEVAAGRARLDRRARELAEEAAALAPLTLRATKEALRRLQAADVPDSDLILSCYMSEDFREGISAFLEKRPPRWRGR